MTWCSACHVMFLVVQVLQEMIGCLGSVFLNSFKAFALKLGLLGLHRPLYNSELFLYEKSSVVNKSSPKAQVL